LPTIFILASAQSGTSSLISFFADAGILARVVFGTLVLLSLVSWGIMLNKSFQLRRAARHTRDFLEIFHASKRFSEVQSATSRLFASPLVGLFHAGYLEVDSQVKAGVERSSSDGAYRIRSIVGVERSLRRAIGDEVRVLARGTPFLATTASASPFIGLFGTVWGIMVAFNEIATSGSTSIVAVAPGIAEALINTAAGLAAAIPALIGYNHYRGRLRDMASQMEDFCLEFLNLTERNFS
jgi:biopolymer transport protein TolQ